MENIIIHNIDQRTPEWMALRAGKITGSEFYQMMGNGETRKQLLIRKAQEQLGIHKTEASKYVSRAMVNGIRQEPFARKAYEEYAQEHVQEVGFIEWNDASEPVWRGFCGCSPDGLVGRHGIIEIKCPQSKNFYKTTELPRNYFWQIIYNCLISHRDWCDYVVYNPEFPLYVKRIIPHAVDLMQAKSCIRRCVNEIQHYISLLRG